MIEECGNKNPCSLDYMSKETSMTSLSRKSYKYDGERKKYHVGEFEGGQS